VASLFWADYPSYPQPVEQDTTLVEFDVGVPPLRHGVNTVEIHLHAGDAGESVLVEGVEITVAYRKEA